MEKGYTAFGSKELDARIATQMDLKKQNVAIKVNNRMRSKTHKTT